VDVDDAVTPPESESEPGPDLSAGLDLGSIEAEGSAMDEQAVLRQAIEKAFGAGALNLLEDDAGDLARFEEQAARGGDGASLGLDELIAEIDSEYGPSRLARLTSGVTPRKSEASAAAVKHIVFALGETHFAVPMSGVLEIQRPPRVTPVPNVPAWVLGVANLRGEIISVSDLRTFFGFEAINYEHSGRIMVVRSADQELTTGLIVDRVIGMVGLSPDRLATPAAGIEDPIAPFMSGITEDGGRLIVAIDLEGLLQSREMRQFQST
jgi:purine-binding chemotaxis protein CheW